MLRLVKTLKQKMTKLKGLKIHGGGNTSTEYFCHTIEYSTFQKPSKHLLYGKGGLYWVLYGNVGKTICVYFADDNTAHLLTRLGIPTE